MGGATLVKVVQTTFSVTSGDELGLQAPDFTPRLGEGGHFSFLRGRGYTEQIVCQVRHW